MRLFLYPAYTLYYIRGKNPDPWGTGESATHKKSLLNGEAFAARTGLVLGFAAFEAKRRKNPDPWGTGESAT
ncbi:MAG: hypothetical protein KBT12_04470, partial [Bacteroidales bacterium]|nr:hypothetical protein [Candidatus Physcousia equi]